MCASLMSSLEACLWEEELLTLWAVTLALEVSNKTLFVFYAEEKKKRKEVWLFKRKIQGRRRTKSHLKTQEALCRAVTVTLIPTQTQALKRLPFCLPCFKFYFLKLTLKEKGYLIIAKVTDFFNSKFGTLTDLASGTLLVCLICPIAGTQSTQSL